jgi:hypothetical protein
MSQIRFYTNCKARGSRIANEIRLPHVEYRGNNRSKPSNVLCTAIAQYVFYMRIKLHIASIQFAFDSLGKGRDIKTIMIQIEENVHYGSAKSNGIVNTIERKEIFNEAMAIF